MAEVVLAFALAEIPEQEADDDQGHSAGDERHQQGGHVDAAALVLACGVAKSRSLNIV